MKPLRVSIWAAAVWAATVLPAAAAWNNVFQVTCFNCGPRSSTSAYAAAPVVVHASPAPCNPCPQTNCSTSYVQRCYYEPVTSYQTQSYYEPVTTYQTSYYYEPVTSYRYSCYYDPCSCSYHQVATPTTSYQLRAQNCPVQSWVQRCVQVPVTAYRKSCYWQPQTTCCTTTSHAPLAVAAPPVVTAPPPAAPATPPAVQEQRTPTQQPPQIQEQRQGNGNQQYDRYYPQPTTPGTSLKANQTAAPRPLSPPPPVKLERIAQDADAKVEGQLVRSDNTPRSNTRVLFVNASNQADQQIVTTNHAGRFQAALVSGNWLVYVHDANGQPVFHSRINVGGGQSPPANLVNR